MENYFEISGYWKDDKSEFEGYIVTDFDDFNPNNEYGFEEEDIFFFGLSEEILELILNSEEEVHNDFVITGYKKM